MSSRAGEEREGLRDAAARGAARRRGIRGQRGGCNRRPTGSPRTGGATGLGPKEVRDLSGCCENVDVSETPFTNTLPIRRLGLTSGESAEIRVAYFDATELQSWRELVAISSPGK
jgi:hypothetical protein